MPGGQEGPGRMSSSHFAGGGGVYDLYRDQSPGGAVLMETSPSEEACDVHSIYAEYCAPVSCRSLHASKVDVAINGALRIITGCLKPTPVSFLPVLAGIAPAGLRQRLPLP
ncbi:piggyBac transposable element-derived protein 4-like [Xyrichtys novacula]|uniref:PiggyBac transposable element-derived protein 4-like n=1 Tax=Xyrichtys novacula TaxID=13765 RepID=A0AAV1GU55_XYRNO|nr:piggyBac transposable element-derived protein 4-like [Xyrichtys novacula]